jgi:hypothetical protein
MSKTAPEVAVEVRRIVRNKKDAHFELHLEKILDVRNWDTKRQRPKIASMPPHGRKRR